jgi:hypothetical protein
MMLSIGSRLNLAKNEMVACVAKSITTYKKHKLVCFRFIIRRTDGKYMETDHLLGFVPKKRKFIMAGYVYSFKQFIIAFVNCFRRNLPSVMKQLAALDNPNAPGPP